MKQLRNINLNELPLIDPEVRIAPPIGQIGKILFIGFNSRLHCEEMGIEVKEDEDMVVFMKPTSCICGPYDPIFYGPLMKKLDWEAELGIVIGKKGKYIPLNQASEYIFGYLCVNDLSERHWQFEKSDKQFTKGKCFDHAAPIALI